MPTSPKPFTLRKATAEDCCTLLELIKALAEYERMPEAVIATEDTLKEAIFGRKRATVFLAEVGEAAVGFALCFFSFSTFIGRETLYLEDLYVKPSHRGHGIGKALFMTVAKEAVDTGCARLDWVCLDWNRSAIDFYTRLGATNLKAWQLFRLDGLPLQALAKGTSNQVPQA
ncbi:MAG: GNAT family N-acetyltransferase [Acholeplasmatales bacterium]|nr:MAG: GNAT family N-acetyltransferase [Acholeplasmatales bacterium]